MLLIIDNYDSFTFNLAHYFKELNVEVLVKRNDAITLKEIETLNPQYLVLSPGPSTPSNAGITLDAIRYFKGKIPMLGVCLGHQAIAEVFGGEVIHANKIMHGKVSTLSHNSQHALFKGIPQQFQVTRYHSLIVAKQKLPNCLAVIAETCEADTPAEIMAISHKTLPIVGVQFHPESIKTAYGHKLLQNFLENSSKPRIHSSS